ncbi:MAG: phosphate/phosphite/phosphonate ABC transporter substrate-binding protein [Methylomicrobium sp.]
MIKTIVRSIVIVILSMTLPVEAKTIRFGIVPQQAPMKLAELWGPVLKHLSHLTGYDIQFKTAPDIPSFEQRVLAKEYDIAYMNPYHFVFFNAHSGYRAIAREAGNLIQGIIVVAKNSPIQSLTELHNLSLAFPSPAAFAATVLPQAELKQMGITFTPKYVSSHDSVYRSVAKGIYPAGGGIMRTFNNLAPDVREQLRILWNTRQYTPHAIAVSPNLDDETQSVLQKALLALNDSEESRALLGALNFNGIETAKDSDWDDIRALQIDLLDSLIVP